MTATLFDFPEPTPPAPKAKKPRARPGYTGEFLAFWELYPPRYNSSKFLAFKEWAKLTPEEQTQAMIAVPVYARSRIGQGEEYTKHAAHWLHGKYFETIARPCQKASAQTDIDWPTVLKLYRMTSNWRSDLGPAPGMPNCRVPAKYLSEMS